MPLGLRNASETFQRFIDHAVRGLPFVYAYLDNLLVFSNTSAELETHLRLLLECLAERSISLKKCKGVVVLLEFNILGDHFYQHGIRPLSGKVQSITRFPPPASV